MRDRGLLRFFYLRVTVWFSNFNNFLTFISLFLLVNPTNTEDGKSYFKSRYISDSDENDASGKEPNDGVDDVKDFVDTTLHVCTDLLLCI